MLARILSQMKIPLALLFHSFSFHTSLCSPTMIGEPTLLVTKWWRRMEVPSSPPPTFHGTTAGLVVIELPTRGKEVQPLTSQSTTASSNPDAAPWPPWGLGGVAEVGSGDGSTKKEGPDRRWSTASRTTTTRLRGRGERRVGAWWGEARHGELHGYGKGAGRETSVPWLCHSSVVAGEVDDDGERRARGS